MERLLIALALAGLAIAVALALQRRARGDPPVRTGYAVPDQLDRADFVRPEAPWLVAVFTSAACGACEGAWEAARHLESAEVAIEQLEVASSPELHRRYRIEAVPTTVLADAEGVVRASFLGPVTASHLAAELAELRQPGCAPGACGRRCDKRDAPSA